MSQVSTIRPILTTNNKVQIFLTGEFEQKVRHLCCLFPEREWSGMLFYRVRDVNVEIDKFEIDVVDFFPMSVNTKAHTDFQYDSEYVTYLIDNDLTDCIHGLIHSHNSFGVFFSGEDMSELQDNTGNHSFYLSLIVNNKFDVTAKLNTIVKFPKVKEVGAYKDINGKERMMEVEQEEVEYLYSIDCIINKPVNTLTFNADWTTQLSTIIEKDRIASVPKVKTVGQPFAIPGNQAQMNFGERDFGYDAWSDPKWNQKTGEVTVRTLQDFVINDILEGTKGSDLQKAAKDYDFWPDPSLVTDIIGMYDLIFGKTDVAEEIQMLKGVVNILSDIKGNKDIGKLITELKAGIAIREKKR